MCVYVHVRVCLCLSDVIKRERRECRERCDHLRDSSKVTSRGQFLHVSYYLVDYLVLLDFGRKCCCFLPEASASYGGSQDCDHYVVIQLLDHLLRTPLGLTLVWLLYGQPFDDCPAPAL